MINARLQDFQSPLVGVNSCNRLKGTQGDHTKVSFSPLWWGSTPATRPNRRSRGATRWLSVPSGGGQLLHQAEGRNERL